MADLPPYILRRQRLPPLWNHEKLFFDGDEFYADILQSIDKAQRLITVEMYIFAQDPLGQRFYLALEKAAQRGVTVYLLVDGLGSHGFIQFLHTIDLHPNFKVKVYNPHPWTYSQFQLIDVVSSLQTFFKRLLGINRRNHRKIITIDEIISYTGSFNITTDHSKEFKQDEAWHDIGIKLEGWITPLFILSLMKHWGLKAFYMYRRKSIKKRFVRFNHPDIRLNQNFRLRRSLYKDFLKRLKKSKKRIWLVTGYFQPKRSIINSLKAAARQGVDVRILLSTKSDVFYYSLLQTYYHYELLDAGVKIFEFDPSIIHAKNYFIDDWITVGSTNLNYRSFMHDLEVDIRIQHPQNKKLLEKNFQEQESASTPLTFEQLNLRPWWKTIASRLIFLFRYWN